MAAAGGGDGPGREGSGGGTGVPSAGAAGAPLELMDISEEVEEAAEILSSGTTGGWMGSGARVLLPRVPVACVADLIPFRARVPVRDSWVL